MAAIRWDNINAPSIGEASRAMYLGGLSIDKGFDRLGDVLKQREATDTANWNQQKVNNTNGLFNKLLGYSTPEEYQAAMASGELQQEMTGMGAQVDQNAIRQAMDKRLPELQQRAVQQQQFADQQLDVQSRPIVDQLSTMALSEDKDLRASAKAALGVYANQGLLNKPAELAAKIDAADYGFTTRDRATEKFGFEKAKAEQDQKMYPLEIQAKQASIQESSDRSALSKLQREEIQKESTSLSGKQLTAERERITALYNSKKADNLYAGGKLGTPTGDKTFLDSLDKKMDNTDRTDIGDALKRVQERLGGVPVPVSIAQEAVFFSSNGLIENRGEEVEKRILEKMLPNIETYNQHYKDLDTLTGSYQSALAGIGSTPGTVKESTPAATSTPTKESVGSTPTLTLPKPTPASTGSWSISKAPTSPYKDVGITRPDNLPLEAAVGSTAKGVASILDIINGKNNFDALGKPYSGAEDWVEKRLKKAKGK